MGKPIYQDDYGHYAAEAIYQRNRRAEHPIMGHPNNDGKRRYESGLVDPSKEKDIAIGIYDIVSSQRILIKDAVSLIEKVLKDHDCNYLLIRGKRVLLSRAKGHLSDFATCLLFKYNLPVEPAENSEIMLKR